MVYLKYWLVIEKTAVRPVSRRPIQKVGRICYVDDIASMVLYRLYGVYHGICGPCAASEEERL